MGQSQTDRQKQFYFTMKAFVAFLSCLAVAAAKPGYVAQAPVAYNYGYNGLINTAYADAYPAAEPYIHQEIPAEPYLHEEIAAEPYIHQEIPAEPYIHEEVLAEPYIHQEPITVAAPIAVAPA